MHLKPWLMHTNTSKYVNKILNFVNILILVLQRLSMKYLQPIILSILIFSSLLLIPGIKAHDGTTFEAYTSNAPTIDGVINDDEWADASTVTFSIPEGEVTIYVMNDRRYLYIAAKVADNTLDEVVNVALDIFTIDFDGRHDGQEFNVGEDTISIGARNRIGDGFVGPGLDIIDDSQIDVDGLVSRIGNFNHFEISHPIDSGDANDIAGDYGKTIGVRFLFFDQSGSDNSVISVFPIGVGADDRSQSQWADITIATPTDDAGSSDFPITEAGIIIVLLGWAVYFGSIIRKRRN